MKRWTPKAAVARSSRSIAAAIADLRKVSIEWADIDGFLEHRAEELIRELEAFNDEIRAQIEDRLEAGEEIGL